VLAGRSTTPAIRRLEASNIRTGFRAVNGKVTGPGGAAHLRRLKPTTFSSRIDSLGILARRVPDGKYVYNPVQARSLLIGASQGSFRRRDSSWFDDDECGPVKWQPRARRSKTPSGDWVVGFGAEATSTSRRPAQTGPGEGERDVTRSARRLAHARDGQPGERRLCDATNPIVGVAVYHDLASSAFARFRAARKRSSRSPTAWLSGRQRAHSGCRRPDTTYRVS
jgi:hypothetical protein